MSKKIKETSRDRELYLVFVLEEIEEGNMFCFRTVFLLIVIEIGEKCDADVEEIRIFACQNCEVQTFLSTVTATEETTLLFLMPCGTRVSLD